MNRSMKKLLFLALFPITLSSCNGFRKDTMGYFDYGIYPQSVVSSKLLIEELDKLDNPDQYGFYKYENALYYPYVATPYRENLTFNDGVKVIEEGEKYWFHVAPVTWSIISEFDNIYFVTSAYVLDAYHFSDNLLTYRDSDIRSYLNIEVYNRLFSGKDYKIETTVTEEFKDEELNAVDHLFPLSYDELNNKKYGFTAENRRIKVTDFALARGSSKYYWTRTRSQVKEDKNYAYAVNENGEFEEVEVSSTLGVRMGFRVASEPIVKE